MNNKKVHKKFLMLKPYCPVGLYSQFDKSIQPLEEFRPSRLEIRDQSWQRQPIGILVEKTPIERVD